MVSNYRSISPVFGDLPAAPPQLIDAACARVDSELFFPHPHATGQQSEARAVCKQCPVAMSCLTWSLQLHSALPYGLEGVWAGLTHAQRSRWLKGQAA